MLDNQSNNKRIAKNTLLLYFRMLLTMAIGLYTSRVILQALGVSDYGLYNVVGGVVTMFTFINGSMAAGTQRFITFELGAGNMVALKKVFSTSIVVHLLMIAAIFLLAETVGVWFVSNKMVFEVDRETAAMWVYQFSVIACLLSIIQAPFMASIIAHEKMNIYAYMSIYDALVKLGIVFLIQWSPIDRLIYYAGLVFLANLSSVLIYNIYCQRHYEECRLTLKFDKPTFKKMFSFSAWDVVGSLATVGQAQGVNIVINMFCGTVVNAARGISVTVNTMVMQFVNNFLMAANPQLIKYYANKQINEMVRLAINTANLSTYLLLFVGIPVFIEIEFLLHIWLGVYPDYAPVFCRIILLQSLIQAMGTPTMRSLHAVGNIRMMNILVGTLLLLILPCSYLLFRIGCSVEIVLCANIIPWLTAIPIRLLLLKRYINFPFFQYINEVLFRGFIVAALIYVFPYLIHTLIPSEGIVRFIIVGLVSVIASIFVISYVGLNKHLQQKMISKVKAFIENKTGIRLNLHLRTTFKRITPVFLILSLMFNVVCILPYAGSYIDRISERFHPTQFYSAETPNKTVMQSVVNASLEMDGTTFSCEQPKRGLIYDVHQYFSLHPSTPLYNNYSLGYLYAGLSEYALAKQDTVVRNHLIAKVADFTTKDKLSYDLVEVDQVPIGLCFLNLYKMTGNNDYLSCAQTIYDWLLSRRSNDSNVIYYREGNNQFVDALGMYIPFLAQYAEVTNDSIALTVAYENMREFYKYGVDKETGLPSHGYNIKNHVKVGSANWGRGIGWYVLAAMYLPEFRDDALDSNLTELKQSQFPCTSGEFDSSTALLFELYMQTRGLHSPSINFIKSHTTTSGLIMSCSGDTYDFNNHSRIMKPAELTQGLFLMLVSKFDSLCE